MNKNISYFKSPRFIAIAVIFIISIIISGIYSIVHNADNIEQTHLTVCLSDETKSIFEHQYNETKSFYKYYNYDITTDSKNSDFIFTTDFSSIDSTKDYSVEGYSPLVVCFKDTKNLNNYLKTTTKKGFLTCNNSSKIKNNITDNITCDFNRIIDVVVNGEDWSDLGGEDKKITIYCPDINTVDGNLFYKFLLITINNGKYPTDNLVQVEEKANTFLNSSNVVQTNVVSKIEKLGTSVQENDIYILFESDLLVAAGSNPDICITYPQLTVIKEIYLQFNNIDIKDGISEAFYKGNSSLSWYLGNHNYYITTAIIPNSNRRNFFNVQNGFNYYNLTN